jgi:hypothetical protein
MMEWFRQMYELVQRSQPRGTPQQSPQPQPQMQPQMMQGPTTPPPRGMMWAWMPEMGAFALMPAPSSAPSAGPMYRGPNPRAPYYPQGDPSERPWQPPQQPQRQLSPADQFREAIGVVRTAVSVAEEFDALLPGRRGGGYVEEPHDADQNGPVRVDEIGKLKTVRNNDEHGALRIGETLLTNLPEAVKWVGEQVDKINREKQKQQQPQQQLPPGYVEVHPGDQPPPGYVAVRVDSVPQQEPQEHLPPPPSHMPPPIQTPQAPQRRTWDVPTIPENEQ